MKLKSTVLTAVNHARRTALTNVDIVVPITSYFNEDGECDFEDAVSFVAGRDGVGWWNYLISDFETPKKPN